jgi:hypothetical protein
MPTLSNSSSIRIHRFLLFGRNPFKARSRILGGRNAGASQTILVTEVEENLEGGASERLQGINTKTHLPIKNNEFE